MRARLVGIPQKLCMKDVIDICDGYRKFDGIRWISVAPCLFWQAPWRSIICVEWGFMKIPAPSGCHMLRYQLNMPIHVPHFPTFHPYLLTVYISAFEGLRILTTSSSCSTQGPQGFTPQVILQHDPHAAGLISSNASKVLPIRRAIAHGNILLMTPQISIHQPPARSIRSSRWFAFCSKLGILGSFQKSYKNSKIIQHLYIKIYNHTQLSTNLRCRHGPLSFMACLSGNDCNLACRRGSSTAGNSRSKSHWNLEKKATECNWMQGSPDLAVENSCSRSKSTMNVKNKTQLTKECM